MLTIKHTGILTGRSATDLKLFAPWCEEAKLDLFGVRRAHLELYGHWMEETGDSLYRGSLLSTLASF